MLFPIAQFAAVDSWGKASSGQLLGSLEIRKVSFSNLRIFGDNRPPSSTGIMMRRGDRKRRRERCNPGPRIELAGDAVDAWPLVSPLVSEQSSDPSAGRAGQFRASSKI
jgi:hypothetical protein